MKISVYKSRRKDAMAQFIADARELRIVTMRMVKRFPKSYRWIVTNNLLQLAGDVYVNCIKGNAIYLHKGMDKGDYELRHRYFKIAVTSCDALMAEITFCYYLVSDGENFFEGRKEYDEKFLKWTEVASKALNRIRAVIESDKKRYAK